MNNGSMPAFSSPSSESHPGSAGTDAELQAALEAARAAEAHVLELMEHTQQGADIGTPGNPPDNAPSSADAPTEAPAPVDGPRIEIFRPMDRDALVITAGDHSVCVPMRAIRDRLRAEGVDSSVHLVTADLLELAPYILEHPEEFGAIGEYTVSSAAE